MRSPQVRFTVRRMMLAVAAVALLLWGREMWQVRSEYLLMAEHYSQQEAGHKKILANFEKQATRRDSILFGKKSLLRDKSEAGRHNEWKETIKWSTQYVGYYARLRRTYEEAARHPWWPAPVIKNAF